MKKAMIFQIVIVLLGAALLAACGQGTVSGSNPNAPAGNPIVNTGQGSANTAPAPTSQSQSSGISSLKLTSEACTLLTKDQVSAVFGETVDSVQGNGLGKLGGCDYKSKNLDLQLSVLYSGGAKTFDGSRKSAGQQALAVNGLGDGAFINNVSGILVVLKGDTEYNFWLTDSSLTHTQDQESAMEKTLASTLLSNLH